LSIFYPVQKFVCVKVVHLRFSKRLLHTMGLVHFRWL
jgi:hypothetical protein